MELFKIGGGPMATTSNERDKKWRAAHPEQARQGSTERSRKWRAAHPEENRKQNLEAVHRYRAKKRAEREAAKAENQPPQNTAKLSDPELASIYQGLKDKGLV